MSEHEQIMEVALRTHAVGLTQGTSGNVSCRFSDGFLITPTGVAYDQLAPDKLVAVGMDGSVARGQLRPSSEWRFHRDIYAVRPELSAVIHVHSTYATALACRGMDIPAFHYMVAIAGGDSIRCGRYALFGSQALSDIVLAALQDRQACLLANHGMIAAGRDLEQAFGVTLEVEHLAKVYTFALQLGGPNHLSEQEMEQVLAKFKVYGQQEPQDARISDSCGQPH